MKTERLPLVYNQKFVGFRGYEPEGMFCMIANGDNNFLLFGIAEGSLLLIDPKKSYEEGKLNVLRKEDNREQQWKLSLANIEGFSCIGRVIMSVMQYD